MRWEEVRLSGQLGEEAQAYAKDLSVVLATGSFGTSRHCVVLSADGSGGRVWRLLQARPEKSVEYSKPTSLPSKSEQCLLCEPPAHPRVKHVGVQRG